MDDRVLYCRIQEYLYKIQEEKDTTSRKIPKIIAMGKFVAYLYQNSLKGDEDGKIYSLTCLWDEKAFDFNRSFPNFFLERLAFVIRFFTSDNQLEEEGREKRLFIETIIDMSIVRLLIKK